MAFYLPEYKRKLRVFERVNKLREKKNNLMKVIFLDIDGVLATEESSKQPNHEIFSYRFDSNCVSIFNQILAETNAEIILSSDWRLMYNNDLEVLDELFKHNGILKSPIDVTPNLGRNREKEIAFYLESALYEITDFVILDDTAINGFPKNFVRCNINEGLKQNGIKEKIVSVLN